MIRIEESYAPLIVGFERRRYGNTTMTWAYVKLNGEWISLGDPWPCVVPKKDEVMKEIGRAIHETNHAN